MASITYSEADDSLLWLANGTRLDMAYAVNQVASHQYIDSGECFSIQGEFTQLGELGGARGAYSTKVVIRVYLCFQ